MHCAETEREANEGASQWIGNYSDTAIKHHEYDEPEHFRGAKGYEFHAMMADATKRSATSFRDNFLKTQVFGTPEKCIEPPANDLPNHGRGGVCGFFKYDGMPLEVAQRSMKRFATKILPHIQRDNAREHRSAAAGS